MQFRISDQKGRPIRRRVRIALIALIALVVLGAGGYLGYQQVIGAPLSLQLAPEAPDEGETAPGPAPAGEIEVVPYNAVITASQVNLRACPRPDDVVVNDIGQPVTACPVIGILYAGEQVRVIEEQIVEVEASGESVTWCRTSEDQWFMCPEWVTDELQ